MSSLTRRVSQMLFGGANETQVRLKPKIGITGSFGRGNYGDELFVKTYQHWLGSWADLSLLTGLQKKFYGRISGDARVDEVDAVILGGGDLLIPHLAKIDSDFVNASYLRRPLHVAGIGVQQTRYPALPEVVEQWRVFLNDSAIRSISTRDSGSKAWIEANIKPSVPVAVHADLVCAMPLPPVVRPEGPPILGLVTRHVKNPKDYVHLAEAARRLMAKGWRVRHIIGGIGGHGEKDFKNAQELVLPGKETMYSEELDDISRALGECSLVLSMKLHTTVVATMYGVPTVNVNSVGKARAFMRSIGREELVVDPTKPAFLKLIDAGVPPVPMDQVQRLREDASAYLRDLGQRVWDDFRNASPERARNLPASPPFPE